jgi:hypothetical protein
MMRSLQWRSKKKPDRSKLRDPKLLEAELAALQHILCILFRCDLLILSLCPSLFIPTNRKAHVFLRECFVIELTEQATEGSAPLNFPRMRAQLVQILRFVIRLVEFIPTKSGLAQDSAQDDLRVSWLPVKKARYPEGAFCQGFRLVGD